MATYIVVGLGVGRSGVGRVGRGRVSRGRVSRGRVCRVGAGSSNGDQKGENQDLEENFLLVSYLKV